MAVALAPAPDSQVRDPDPLLVLGHGVNHLLDLELIGVGVGCVGVGVGQLDADEVLVVVRRHGLRADQLFAADDVDRRSLRRVLLGVFRRRRRRRRLVVRRSLQRRKNDPDVGGRHPVLQDRAVLEVLGTWPIGQSGKCNPGWGVVVQVRVEAKRLLLVGAGDRHLDVALEHGPAVRRVELEKDSNVNPSMVSYLRPTIGQTS